MPLLECRGLSKTFRQGSGPRSAHTRIVNALLNVNLTIDSQSTVAIVGQSGCGKTTLAKCLALIERPDAGVVLLEGIDPRQGKASQLEFHRSVQLLFQNTAAAMNPRFSAAEIVQEPLRLRGHIDHKEQRERALAIMQRTGLDASLRTSRPSKLSGGQQQRLALARALVCVPKVLILDEGLAALDIRSRIRILDLLLELKQIFGLTYVFITHDLRLIASLEPLVFTMERGVLLTH